MIDHYRHVRAGEVLVSVESFGGEFWLDARSHLLQRLLMFGNYEPENVGIVERIVANRPGDVIDVGTNVGFFSILLAKKIGPNYRVLSVEPNAQAVALLKKNIAGNGVENIVLFEGIAADKAEQTTLNYVDGMPEYSSPQAISHESVPKDNLRSQEVQSATIDQLVQTYDLRPVFLKIDVEGSEMAVIQGTRETLKNFQPYLLVEIVDDLHADGQSRMLEIFAASHYSVYTKDLKKATPPLSGDYICLPESVEVGEAMKEGS